MNEYSTFNGKPIYRVWEVCPAYRRWLLFGNGHDWSYHEQALGERPNPVMVENPPSPPLWEPSDLG